MQILKITNIKGRLIGGSTNPLLINAINSRDKEVSYVMKTYNSKNNEETFAIAKEIIISELAKQFDLNVPEYGLVKVNDEMLADFYSKDEISGIDKGYKFCTEFIQGSVTANSEISKKFLDIYDYSKLFAFDQLIMNSDRGGFNNKANLLYTDEKMILIDHEITLPFYMKQNNEDTNFFNLFHFFYSRKHIFWNRLNGLKDNEKKHIFDEFVENLRNMNFDFLNFVFEDLKKHNIPYGNKEIIFAYLMWAKSNIAKLQNMLNQKI
jgi:hypothetical protein